MCKKRKKCVFYINRWISATYNILFHPTETHMGNSEIPAFEVPQRVNSLISYTEYRTLFLFEGLDPTSNGLIHFSREN
jgi:hypothetical protein